MIDFAKWYSRPILSSDGDISRDEDDNSSVDRNSAMATEELHEQWENSISNI